MVMFDHVGLNVRDYAASRAFFTGALAPLGYRIVMEFEQWKTAGFGKAEKPEFWISEREPFGTGTHVAFGCPDRATVDAFHDAALAAGGRDNGEPGPREVYHPTYYGAFILDPDGNNIEAVCHRPQ
jgi:catechol 2,3-dioxygenase-like lactoylglutathione lyase family enzyme